ncbi:MAG: 3-dehydroquinate synthase [Lachnospiraceae bacterium]|nr:3-dehydroquinate synthase [Lachnospiraceae bacterium]
MKIVQVSASKNYEVIIDKDLLPKSGGYIRERAGGRIAVIITDDIVDELYSDTVIKSLEDNEYNVLKYVVKNGESSKNSENYIRILEYLALHKVSRSDVLVALGGGVVGDLTGFVAATYLRGVKFVQIPTTLLAAVDSSVGGKTAIDLEAGKNLVGAFYQPQVVLCDYNTLNTLTEEVFSDGCAEVIKYGVIASEELFEACSQGIKENIENIIYECVKIKRDIVAQDEFDTGLRQLLNFGHTIGHGIEACSNYEVTHGKAVAIGMILITKASVKLGICEKIVLDRLEKLIKLCALPFDTHYGVSELYQVMLSDKKVDGKMINLVVPTTIGKAILKRVSIDEMKDILNKCFENGGIL